MVFKNEEDYGDYSRENTTKSLCKSVVVLLGITRVVISHLQRLFELQILSFFSISWFTKHSGDKENIFCFLNLDGNSCLRLRVSLSSAATTTFQLSLLHSIILYSPFSFFFILFSIRSFLPQYLDPNWTLFFFPSLRRYHQICLPAHAWQE